MLWEHLGLAANEHTDQGGSILCYQSFTAAGCLRVGSDLSRQPYSEDREAPDALAADRRSAGAIACSEIG